MRTLFGTALLVLGALSMPLRAAQPPVHGLLGHWRYDAAKSSFSGAIPYQSAEISYTRTPLGIHVVQDIVEGTSSKLHFEYVDTRDGRAARVKGNPFYDSQSTQWPDARTAVRSEMRAGKITGTTIMKVADDGNTYTATSSRTLPNGRTYNSIIAWYRLPE
ncbi:MAG: hypothetical protein ABIT36_02500 [Steroidobacteraceae bacterium]